ncbi:MAG: STAS domain-containing protein [Phycisphaerae bacterium]
MADIIQNVRWEENVAVVSVMGDIDYARSTGFQSGLLAIVDKKPDKIVIDLSDVGYMDSSGVASLVKLLSRMKRRHQSLALTGLSDRVRNIFQITRLEDVFDIYGSEQEATG